MPIRVEACSPEEAMQKLKQAILACCCGGDTTCLCQCSSEYMLQPATLHVEFDDWEDCVYTNCVWMIEVLGVIPDVPPFDNCGVFLDPTYLPGGAGFNTAFGELGSSIQSGSWDACCTIGEGAYEIPLESTIKWEWNPFGGEEGEPYPCGYDPVSGFFNGQANAVGWEDCLDSLPECATVGIGTYYPFCFNNSPECATVVVRFPDNPAPGEHIDITWTGDRYEIVSFVFTVVNGACTANMNAQVVTEWNWNATPEQAALLPDGIGRFCTVRRAGFGPYQSSDWDPFCAATQPCIPCETGPTFQFNYGAPSPCLSPMTINCDQDVIYGANDYTGVSFIIECDRLPKPTGP